jgi:tripartite-type tricarboxylate transporter receptor subunit TctC
MTKMQFTGTPLAFAFVLGMAATASAQVYPSRPVTLIVPFPAGGGVDAMARITAERLTAAFGQQVVIDNRGGAAGVIGTRAAATAIPDGYTLVMSTSGTTSINPSLYANPGYDTLKDFTPIGLVASTPIVVMAHPSFRATSISELIALARTQEHLDVGTPPPGTENYLAAELFKSMTGINMTIVSYKGTGPLTNDLVGGHISVAFNTIAPALGNLQSKLLRALAVAGRTRSVLLPDVPTVGESGLPGFEATVRYGLLAPIGTPRPIIDRINSELRATVSAGSGRSRIAAQGGEPLFSTPEEYAADIDREQAKWGLLIKKLGLRVD